MIDAHYTHHPLEHVERDSYACPACGFIECARCFGATDDPETIARQPFRCPECGAHNDPDDSSLCGRTNRPSMAADDDGDGTHDVDLNLRPETLLEYSDPNYQTPTPAEVREALRVSGLTGSAAGTLLGVSSRTVRKWTGGDQGIQYSAWRLLLIAMGAVRPPKRLKAAS